MLGDDLLELGLGPDRDADRIPVPGELVRIDAAVDVRDLGGREGDDLVLRGVAEEDVEVVEVAAGGADDHHTLRIHRRRAYAAGEDGTRETTPVRPETMYARSGDVSIAYQVVGDGPFDLVYVPGFISHVELRWNVPSFARYISELAEFSRLILFDKRGTGMSDRVSGAPTLEARMDDLRAVDGCSRLSTGGDLRRRRRCPDGPLVRSDLSRTRCRFGHAQRISSGDVGPRLSVGAQ